MAPQDDKPGVEPASSPVTLELDHDAVLQVQYAEPASSPVDQADTRVARWRVATLAGMPVGLHASFAVQLALAVAHLENKLVEQVELQLAAGKPPVPQQPSTGCRSVASPEL